MRVLHAHPLCRSAEVEIVPDRFSLTVAGNWAEGESEVSRGHLKYRKYTMQINIQFMNSDFRRGSSIVSMSLVQFNGLFINTLAG